LTVPRRLPGYSINPVSLCNTAHSAHRLYVWNLK
jgi:hypothetical protein